MDISVVIASYNHAAYVEACILSALNQTHRPAEVIVIDDGSTDGSGDIIESFGLDIKDVYQENRGTYATLNRGIEMAKSDWVAIHNSDDLWEPEKLTRQAAIALADPSVGLVHTGVEYIDAAGATLETVEGADLRAYTAPETYEALPTVLRTNPVVISSVLLSKRTWEAAGKFDERYLGMGDWEFCVRAAQHARFGFATGPLTKVRKHAQSAGMDPNRLPTNWGSSDYLRMLQETMPTAARTLLLQTHKGKLDRNEAAIALASLGTLQAREGKRKDARETFRLAISASPLRIKSYLRYLLSLG